jgi:hypothetical protein
MRDLVRTNDPVLLNFVEVLLADSGIGAAVFDGNMSTAQGTLCIVQKRLAVPDDNLEQARRLLNDAGLGEWIVK